MARIALTFVDQPNGLVDIQVYIDEVVEGADPTPAQKLTSTMLQAVKEQQEPADGRWPTLVLTEADSLAADLAGTPRPVRE